MRRRLLWTIAMLTATGGPSSGHTRRPTSALIPANAMHMSANAPRFGLTREDTAGEANLSFEFGPATDHASQNNSARSTSARLSPAAVIVELHEPATFGLVHRSGPVPVHVDRSNAAAGAGISVGHTVLHYLDSLAIDPPDVLTIFPGADNPHPPIEHAIVAGLRLTIPVDCQHEITSTDPKSLRILVSPHVSDDRRRPDACALVPAFIAVLVEFSSRGAAWNSVGFERS